MQRRDFGLWGLDLTDDDFACATAAAGVAAFRIIVGYGLDTFADVVATLDNSFSDGEVDQLLQWRLPFADQRRDVSVLPPARMLADAWNQVAARRPPFRIMVMDEEGALSLNDLFWLTEQLGRRSVGAKSAFVREHIYGRGRWNWPLRVGFLDDSESQQLRENLQKNYWFTRLWDAFNLGTNEGSCDLLLLPLSIRAAVAAVLAQRSIRATAAISLGGVSDASSMSGVLLATLFEELRLSGMGFVPVQPVSQFNWFENFIDELAHNRTLDVAIWSASRMLNARPPLIFATAGFLEVTRLSTQCEMLGERLAGVGDDVQMEISAKLASDLGFSGRAKARHSVRLIGKQLAIVKPSLRWDHESDSASTMAEIQRSAERALEKESVVESAPRWIQAKVFDCSEAAQQLEVRTVLRRNTAHKVLMQIGPGTEEWITADVAFPAELLPRSETHLLDVVFTESALLSDPQTATIELPGVGKSTSCEFYFQTRQDTNRIRARLTVLHRNRILQTAILRAMVVEDGTEPPADAQIELRIESIIRPGMSDLGERTHFDAALVLNHDDDHQLGVTKLVNDRASFKAPKGLDTEIKWFDATLSEIADDPDKFAAGLKAPATVDALREMAKHGSLLYEAIIEDRITDDAIALAKRLQVVSAEPEARLPVEFFYDRPAPLPGALLCDRAQEALAAGKCTEDCPSRTNPGSVICPLGFWGLNRVIERHAYDPELAHKLGDKDFSFNAETTAYRRSLRPLTEALFAASTRVDKKVSHGVDMVKSEIQSALKRDPGFVSKWTDWVTEIKTKSPSMLVLLVHTQVGKSNLQEIEIGEGQFLEVTYLEEAYLRESKTKPPPLVFLIGCETGAPNLTFHGFVTKLRRKGAAIVLSTGSTILGRHAVPVTKSFVHSMAELIRSEESSFGDVMLRVRQTLMAQGLLMVLCLMAYGDADWKLRSAGP